MGLLFEKPSLRTRVSFETLMQQMGGSSLFLGQDVGWGKREPICDFIPVLTSYLDVLVIRAKSHEKVVEATKFSQCPVINGLTDLSHPCQALADIFTIQEQFGALHGLKLVFVGDGNNVAHSLMLDAPRLGMDIAIATPKGYEPNVDVMAGAEGLAAVSGTTVTVTNDPEEALQGAHAVYTDVWASMGLEMEADQRRIDFQPFQVTPELLAEALPEAVFMHCLPAKRGEETVDEVLESPQSVVFDQAENRLHTQKALLLMLLG